MILRIAIKRGEDYAWLSPHEGQTRTDRSIFAPHSAQYLIETLPSAMPTDLLSIDMVKKNIS
jgi:hypothetical protein